MAIGPDFRPGTFLVHEWIVGRYRSIGIQADDLSEMGIEFLCLFPEMKCVTNGHEQRPIGHECNAGTVVIALYAGRIGGKKLLAIGEACPVRAAIIFEPHQDKGVFLALLGGVGQIDQLVGFEVGVQYDIEQARLHPVAEMHFRIFLSSREIMDHFDFSVCANALQFAGPFGDKHVAIGKKSQ